METIKVKVDVDYPVLSSTEIVKLKMGSPRLLEMYERGIQWIKHGSLAQKIVGEHVVYEIVSGLRYGQPLEEIEESLDPSWLVEELHEDVVDALSDFFTGGL